MSLSMCHHNNEVIHLYLLPMIHLVFLCHNLIITNVKYIPPFRKSLTLLFSIVFKTTAKELSIKVFFSYNFALIEVAEKEKW